MQPYRLAVAALAALTITLAGCGASGDGAAKSAAPSSPSKTAIQTAADSCGAAVAKVGDSGKSISFDTKGKDEMAAGKDTIEQVACVLKALKVPDHVITHIDATRALDGMQTDEWDNYSARWSYHPDSGVNLTVVEK